MSEPEFRDQDAPGETGQPADETAADELEVRPGVAEHYREMTGRGAHQEGEGRIP